ncbi:MAG: 4-hydroxythreonine-4-phosphate dehydrogenase PdxA [Propylenella sp.]
MSGGGRLLALTIGEPAGIGPDIAIDAWLARNTAGVPPFLFVGDSGLLVRRAEAMGRDIRVAAATPGEAERIFPETIPCLQEAPVVVGTPGSIDRNDTGKVVDCIRTAVRLVHTGEATAVVTNPIHKKALDAIGFGFPGHTEFLGQLSEELYGRPVTPVMLLAGPDLRVVPVTIHIPLAEVPRRLAADLIVETGKTVAHDLAHRFGIARPRLAVAGLNPHAGEGGMLGSEDEAVVRPAVEALRAAGIDVTGPLAADSMFHAEVRATYDAALCMYHDQALIPLKTLAFDEGVNVTLGLPFVRTSPDHGTALDIAGRGIADPSSLIAALGLAASMARRRAAAAA